MSLYGDNKDIKPNDITSISSEPLIYTISNFISDIDCNEIIKLVKGTFKPANVSGNKKGMISGHRTGKNTWLSHSEPVISNIIKRISNILNMPIKHAEQIQILHYDVNEEYKNHCDSYENNNSEKTKRVFSNGGQRIYTALCYLNNVKKGGGTRFTILNKTINPEKGKLLIFSNIVKNSIERDNNSEHCGMPVIEGEKYAFNLWFREKPVVN